MAQKLEARQTARHTGRQNRNSQEPYSGPEIHAGSILIRVCFYKGKRSQGRERGLEGDSKKKQRKYFQDRQERRKKKKNRNRK